MRIRERARGGAGCDNAGLSNAAVQRMSKQNQWIVGVNAVASAVENDADNVREILVEGGSKNARLTEIEENARRKGIDVRRVTGQALDGVAGSLRHQGVAARGDFDLTQHSEVSGQKLDWFDEAAKARFIPHVIEPSVGVDRVFLALLATACRKLSVTPHV